MRRVLCPALLVVAISASAGCESIIDADFDDPLVVSCTHASPPPRPALSGSVGGDATITVAAIDLDFLETGDPHTGPFARLGFDLDGLCTNRSQGRACRGFEWTDPFDTDTEDGRDNAVGWMVRDQTRVFGRIVFRSDDLSKGVMEGRSAPSIVLRVSGYNNRSDDDQVRVEWFVAAAPMEDPTSPPDWNDPGHEIALDEAEHALDPGGAPIARIVDDRAYVTRHLLVARFPDGAQMRLANAGWNLSDAVVVAPIDQKGIASVAGDAVTLAGRMAIPELLARLPDVTSFVAGQPTCKDNPLYPQVKAYACRVMDMRLAGNDPSEPCDALSFAIQFRVRPVSLGPLRPSKPAVRCPPATDPSSDDCALPPPGGAP
jgi:hypothetical protein